MLSVKIHKLLFCNAKVEEEERGEGREERGGRRGEGGEGREESACQ